AAIEAGKGCAAVRLVDVADRRPRRLAVIAVDLPGGGADLLLHVGIFLDGGAALGRDLEVRDLPVPVRIGGEEPLERIHAQRDALGVVEAGGAADDGASGQTLGPALDEG